MSLGLYLHIPFCSSICNYCNFNRGLFESGLKDRYVAALEHGDQASAATSAGGSRLTRSSSAAARRRCSTPRRSAASIRACRETLRRQPATPRSRSRPTPRPRRTTGWHGFRAAGVNRISFGVQSFRDDELERLGRMHSAQRAGDAVAEARAAGFDNISLDLMMWLPQQSAADWRENVEALIDVGPDSCLALPARALSERAAEGRDGAGRLVARARRRCGGDVPVEHGAAGARPGTRSTKFRTSRGPDSPSRHNLKYWQDGEWLGFGCGAHSTAGGARWKNVSSTEDYVRRIGLGQPVAVERRELGSASSHGRGACSRACG